MLFRSSGTEVGLAEITSLKESVDTGEQGEFTPNLRAIVAVNPESEHFPVVRSNGITSVVTFPGGGKQIVAGLAALLHTDGWTWEQMSLQSAAALDVTWPEKDATKLEEYFAAAERYRAARPSKRDVAFEAMLPVLEGKIPVAIAAAQEKDILSAIEFCDRHKLRMILEIGRAHV